MGKESGMIFIVIIHYHNMTCMKYFIYARKSTEEDDRQILSIEAQLTELREFAAKEHLAIVAGFNESKTAKEPGKISDRTTGCPLADTSGREKSLG